MHLQDKDLALRHAVAADGAQLAEWWNDGTVMAHAGYPNGLGITVEAVASQLAGDADGVHRRLILELEGRPIGEMNYRDMTDDPDWNTDPDCRTAIIGIKICDFSCQGRGLGRRALSLLITYLFEELGYKKIVLDTNLNNARAQHVYEILGFRRIRIHENAWTDQVGRAQSSVDYELSQADFRSFL